MKRETIKTGSGVLVGNKLVWKETVCEDSRGNPIYAKWCDCGHVSGIHWPKCQICGCEELK